LAGCYLLTGRESERVERFRTHAAEGDRWGLVAQLGAAELLFNTPARDAEREFFYLARDLLEDDLGAEPTQRAALWSGQMALLAGQERIERGAGSSDRGQAYLRRLLPRMATLLDSELTAPERCQAGDVLGHFGDPRFREDAWFLPRENLLGFVEIPEGSFPMGSNKARDPGAFETELPQHEVELPRYYMARYPVTVAQFRVFVEANGEQPDDVESLQGWSNHSVVEVSWHRARQYCAWLTEQLRTWPGTPEPLASLLRAEGWEVSLPSEAEWEKAARGTDGPIYPWGHQPDPNRANYDATNIGTTSAVGCFPAGKSSYGMLDMSGNVWEWTRSLWGGGPGVSRITDIPISQVMGERTSRPPMKPSVCCGAARSTMTTGTCGVPIASGVFRTTGNRWREHYHVSEG
jgi:formylglycine-generating enzyme required for sulfatase activity